MDSWRIAEIVVLTLGGIIAYFLRQTQDEHKSRQTRLEDKSEKLASRLEQLALSMAAGHAEQGALTRRLEEVSNALIANTRAMQDFSNKLTEVSVRMEMKV